MRETGDSHIRPEPPFLLLVVVGLLGFPYGIAAQSNTARFTSAGLSEGLPAFGNNDSELDNRIQGFGRNGRLPKLVASDLANSKKMISRTDTSNDGSISREELRKSKYRKYEEGWFQYDFNRNNKLTANELANYYAKARDDQMNKTRQRANSSQAAIEKYFVQQQQLDLRTTGGYPQGVTLRNWAYVEPKQALRVPKVQPPTERLTLFLDGSQLVFSQGPTPAAQAMFARHDKNGSGELDQDEYLRIDGAIARADADGNGRVNPQELGSWIKDQSPPSSNRAPTAGDWFAQKDVDSDQQVTMAEFANEWTPALVREFNRYDRNRDGMITAAERATPTTTEGRQYRSQWSVVIQPGIGATSEILVVDDFMIEDVNLQLSISHNAPAQLEAILVSPDGRQVQLFCGESKDWQGQIFKKIGFDDEAKTAIGTSPVPFPTFVRPEGADSDEKSGLANYYRSRSKGVWRLTIRGERCFQAGLFDSWALTLVPSIGSPAR